ARFVQRHDRLQIAGIQPLFEYSRPIFRMVRKHRRFPWHLIRLVVIPRFGQRAAGLQPRRQALAFAPVKWHMVSEILVLLLIDRRLLLRPLGELEEDRALATHATDY